MTEITETRANELLAARAIQLERERARFEIVVIGGSALIALHLVPRQTTKDIDIVALRHEGQLVDARPLPDELARARDRVARDFELDEGWLNTGPSDLLRWSLPEGFEERLVRREYGGGSARARANPR